jgi:beta-glucosidase
MRRFLALMVMVACGGDDGVDTSPITYGSIGPLVGDAGKGSWRFGVATAATQIEDMNPNTDWYVWTEPTAQGGIGHGTFVGDAVMGYSKDLDDLGLVADMGLDSYRFSIEWARIEPQRDVIDEAAIAHYRAELEALRAMGIRPLVTIHHFSNPVWTNDPRDPQCANGPTSTNLCGFGSAGGPQIVQEMADHAALLAQRFGDLVDEWGTVNEPFVWMFAAYGVGYFPPGKNSLSDLTQLVAPLRDYIAAQAAMYHAIKANDTIDADGDGVAAAVGFSMSVADWEPSRKNKPSQDAEDIAAQQKLLYLFHYMFVDAAVSGAFDTNFDGVPDEMHPEWVGTIDWLGLQYYMRAGVTGDRGLLLGITPCFGSMLDLGSCLPAPDPTYCSPRMGYESWAQGITTVIDDFSKRYPTLPLVITESGIASNSGKRHAETVVRILEAVETARKHGDDVRGYYHWSLTDNFEWAEGFGPHFGLYSVDYTTYARTATDGATVLGAIAKGRALTTQQRLDYGGTGPMTAEPGASDDPYCTKDPSL